MKEKRDNLPAGCRPGPQFDNAAFLTAVSNRDMKTLENIITKAIREHAWLYWPVGPQKQPVIMQYRDGCFFAAYTAMNYYKKTTGDESVMIANIEKILNFLSVAKDVDGVVFNPYTHNLCMTTAKLGLLTDKARAGTWGAGIPELYEPCDIMQPEDFYDFAMETVYSFIQQDGYTPLFTADDATAIPSAVAEKGGERFHFIVQGALAPTIPEIDEETKRKALAAAKKDGARCVYASVSFGSHDMERFNAMLALRGDGYHCRFTGFEELT